MQARNCEINKILIYGSMCLDKEIINIWGESAVVTLDLVNSCTGEGGGGGH